MDPSQLQIESQEWEQLDESIREYVSGLLLQDDVEDQEELILEIIREYLSEESYSDADLSRIIQDWIESARQSQLAAQQHEQEVQAEISKRAKEMEKLALQTPQINQDPSQVENQPPKRLLTPQERKQRELLLQQYGYNQLDEVRETVDGELEIIYKDTAASTNGTQLERNVNAERIKQQEQQKREQSKLLHQQKVEREKELLEKDRLRKDKERLRTQKREKRRM